MLIQKRLDIRGICVYADKVACQSCRALARRVGEWDGFGVGRRQRSPAFRFDWRIADVGLLQRWRLNTDRRREYLRAGSAFLHSAAMPLLAFAGCIQAVHPAAGDKRPASRSMRSGAFGCFGGQRVTA